MSGTYVYDAVTVETMIREARDHAVRTEAKCDEGRAIINAGLAQAKALIAIATILEMWNRNGVPTLVLK